MDQTAVVIVIALASILGLWLIFYFIPVGLWFSALVSGVRINLIQLVLMRPRKIPPAVMDNPFGDWTGAKKVVLVPAINPDVTIIHVQRADAMGTCSIQGLAFADVEQAKASRHVIVTCENLVQKEELRKNPDLNQIPFIHVSAVCHVPFGGYPTAVYGHYDYDSHFLRQFARAAKDQEAFKTYQKQFIFGVSDHEKFLEKVGNDRLAAVAADPRTGYSVNMKRD